MRPASESTMNPKPGVLIARSARARSAAQPVHHHGRAITVNDVRPEQREDGAIALAEVTPRSRFRVIPSNAAGLSLMKVPSMNSSPNRR
jgi:hypothetical protein